jgi:hypothetical protein
VLPNQEVRFLGHPRATLTKKIAGVVHNDAPWLVSFISTLIGSVGKEGFRSDSIGESIGI